MTIMIKLNNHFDFIIMIMIIIILMIIITMMVQNYAILAFCLM